MSESTKRDVLLYRAKDRIEASLLEAMLEENGIEVWTSGDLSDLGFGELGADAFLVDLRVSEADHAQSIDLVNEYFATSTAEVGSGLQPWICDHCSESVEGSFTSCWSCGKPRDSRTSSDSEAPLPAPQLRLSEPEDEVRRSSRWDSWQVRGFRGYFALMPLIILVMIWLSIADDFVDLVVGLPGIIALAYLTIRWALGITDRPKDRNAGA